LAGIAPTIAVAVRRHHTDCLVRARATVNPIPA